MFDALVDREDRYVARTAEPPVAIKLLEVAQHLHGAVAAGPDAIHEVGSGQVQVVLRDALRDVVEKRVGVVAEQ